MDWHSLIKGFRAYLKLERAMSEHTVEAYVRDLEKVARYFSNEAHTVTAPQITRPQLETFLREISEVGLGVRSRARLLSAIKTFWKYLLTEELTTSDPTRELEGPKLGRHLPEVLSYAEIQAMLESIDLSTDHGVRNRAMLETLYASGLRVSELTSLRLSNLFLEAGFLRVTGKGNKERLVPIGDTAIKHIRLYYEGIRRAMPHIAAGSEDHLFLNRRGKPLSRVTVFTVVKACAEAAGIHKNVSPHTFRHSFATHLIEGGADLKAIQDMLGHESILTTEIYTHLDTDYLRETIMTFHPRNRRKG